MVQANAGVTPPKPRKVHEVTEKLTAVGKIFQTAMLLNNFAVLQ